MRQETVGEHVPTCRQYIFGLADKGVSQPAESDPSKDDIH